MNKSTTAVNKPITTALLGCVLALNSITATVALDEKRWPAENQLVAPGAKYSPAQSGTLAQLIQKYKAADYADAARIGEFVVKNHGNDAVAHYYYASALVKLNRRPQAMEEFRRAYNRTEQPTLKSYCLQAIDALSETEVGSGTAPQAAPMRAVETAAGKSPTPLPDRDIQERKAAILEEGASQIDHLRQQAADDISKLKENVTEQMAGIPRTIVGLRGYRMTNPDYTTTLQKLNEEAQMNIDRINERVAKETAEITDNCNRRVAAYEETMPNMNSQLQAGNSQIQLMPQNSNPYLRNFVNYDGSIPGALKAKAGILPAAQSSPAKPAATSP